MEIYIFCYNFSFQIQFLERLWLSYIYYSFKFNSNMRVYTHVEPDINFVMSIATRQWVYLFSKKCNPTLQTHAYKEVM